MTKPIIIDEVDVSGCKFFDNGMCQMERRSDGRTITECFGYSICYYKQLQRLKAENEKLKKEVSDLNFYIDSYKITWEIDKKEQYKKALEKIREIVLAECKVCGRNNTDRCALCDTNTVLSKTNEVLKDE